MAAVRADLKAVTQHVSRHSRAGTYRFTTYRQRLLIKGAGKPPREISIPSVRDRIALRAYAELLAEIFPECAGKLPQAGVSSVLKELVAGKHDTFVRIDVKNFYPSINHDILLKELGAAIRKQEILRVVRRAIATPTAPDHAPRPRALLTSGVPQGLSISNLLAEAYMRPVDRAMSGTPSLSYHRFVDDILILCSAADALVADASCRAALAGVELSAHPSTPGGKSEIGSISDGFNYLGYTFSTQGVSVRQSSIVRLESHLASIHTAWRQDLARGMSRTAAHQRFLWHRNLTITGCIFQGVASGWIQYFRQLDDLTLLKRLDATVTRLGLRYGVAPTPRPKTFMRAYWAIKHPRSRSTAYIPNFDLYETRQMVQELESMGTSTSGMTEHQVKDTFYRIVSTAVRDLEHDIGDVS
ncbi:reverse transcriptase domain-containing protein [Blastococcus sp. SYSU DS0541]